VLHAARMASPASPPALQTAGPAGWLHAELKRLYDAAAWETLVAERGVPGEKAELVAAQKLLLEMALRANAALAQM